MTSVSAGHIIPKILLIILTPTQPVGSRRPQRGSNPGPPHQKSHALPTELPQPQNQSFQKQSGSRNLEEKKATIDRDRMEQLIEKWTHTTNKRIRGRQIEKCQC